MGRSIINLLKNKQEKNRSQNSTKANKSGIVEYTKVKMEEILRNSAK